MIKCLEYQNFGKNFINTIQTLYATPTFNVKNNNWNTKPITMKRGVRQGCSVSALIFILATEIMNQAIKQNKNINGITINKKINIISQYADDTTLILGSEEEIKYAINKVDNFCKVSGLKLNMKKCKGLWLGNLKQRGNIVCQGIEFSSTSLKCLGEFFGYQKRNMNEQDWMKRVEKIKCKIDFWKQRHLTLPGKITVINTLLLPILINKMIHNIPKQSILKEIEKHIKDFLNLKKINIPYNVLINFKEQGGVRLMDIESKARAISANWMNKFTDKNCPIRFLAEHWYGKIGLTIEQTLYTSVTKHEEWEILNSIPHFYRDILLNFNKIKSECHDQEHKLMEKKQIIWGNTKFKWKKSELFFRNWIQSGFIFITDIVRNRQFIGSEEILKKLKIKSNWMSEYATIKKSIKSSEYWKKERYLNGLTKREDILIHWRGKDYCKKEINTKILYGIIIGSKAKGNNVKAKWTKILQLDTLKFHDTWKKIYKIVWSTGSTKLKDFQYKCINDKLAVGTRISKWLKNIPEDCTMCGKKEDMFHALFDCIHIKHFWNCLKPILKRNIKWQDVLLGFYSDDIISNNLYNEVIFIIKHNIYKANNRGKREGRNINISEIKWKTLYDLQLLKNVILTNRQRMRYLTLLENVIELFEKL